MSNCDVADERALDEKQWTEAEKEQLRQDRYISILTESE